MNHKGNIDVGYVAQLARVDLDVPTRDRLQHDLEAILGYIEQLNELDVTGIEPTAHAAPLFNIWREDVAGQTYDRHTMLDNAPAVIDDELIKVPKILPGEEMS